MRSDWSKVVMLDATSNQSALFQHSLGSYTTLKFVYDIVSKFKLQAA